MSVVEVTDLELVLFLEVSSELALFLAYIGAILMHDCYLALDLKCGNVHLIVVLSSNLQHRVELIQIGLGFLGHLQLCLCLH